MIIQPTSVAALTWLGAAAGASSEGWRIGTVLSARPLGINEQGLMVLQVGALTVEAEAPGTKLPPQFQVRVLSVGAQPQLEILGDTSLDGTVNQALRGRLPQQNGYAPLLATVGALSQWSVARQLPPYLRSALALLEHSMSTPQELATPEGLRQAINRSGVFLEAQLAQAPANDATTAHDDMKGAMLRLMAILKGQPAFAEGSDVEIDPPLLYRGVIPQGRWPLPTDLASSSEATDFLPRLYTDVQAALARLEVAQLQATPGHWTVEIPVQDEDGADVLQLLLKHQEDAEQSWTMGFSLDLPSLGPIVGELHLRGLRLSVRLWAQHRETVDKLEEQFDNLRSRVDATGLFLDQLSCQHGLPQAGSSVSAVFLKATV
ncbi:flagellar hook-length control protein FliK [Dyella psychrodurans]|uniref:Flagellar hook-length control protein FliK n=1 Tax=Dyella psychrodurans TaxID=1927960 RepID=A0A370X088_9GAMM|nr:flagellar hook-length control protein FliK [Dyella psychrodurans]RDS81828.1 flagellar hook-length control protein FliK [Dyella psychrodurans]